MSSDFFLSCIRGIFALSIKQQTTMIEKVRDFFREHYGYVNLQAISDATIEEFMGRSYIKDRSFESQMDLLYDTILANDMTEVQE